MHEDTKFYLSKRRQFNNQHMPKNSPFIDFDEFIPDGPIGYTKKRFVRTFGWYLLNMFDELRDNPNNSYVTCIDDIIYNTNTNEYDFSQMGISSIVKEFTKKTYNNNPPNVEIICSRLANLFGVPTTYIAPHKSNKNKYVVIDFLKANQKLIHFYDFVGEDHIDAYGSVSHNDSLIKNWIERMEKSIDEKVKGTQAQKEQIKHRVLNSFIRQYLYKKYIVHDYDMVGVNFALVYSNDDYLDLNMSPAYDYEMCFNVGIRTMQGEGMEDDLTYLINRFPMLTKTVINSFEICGKDGFIDVEKKNKIKDVFDEHKNSVYLSREQFNIVINSLLTLCGTYRKVKQSNQIHDREQQC